MQLKKNIAISETGFVFDPTTGDSYTLNKVGLEIMELIKQEKTQSEISNIITTKYDVEQSSFEQYYFDFITSLKQMQLIDDYA